MDLGVHFLAEIVGHCTRSAEATTHELVHHVDGGQLHFYISDHDGRNDVHSTDSGVSLNTAQ